MRRLYFVYLFIAATNIFCQDQNIKFQHLTVREGLSQSWIKCILEDRDGFMWFGTGGGGLNKYDGYEFTTYKHHINNKNSLTNNIINCIYEDTKGNLWIGAQGGFSIYKREKDVFMPYPVLQRELIDGFYELENGKMFISAAEGLFLFDPADTSVQQIYDNLYVDGLIKDNNGNFWLATYSGVYLMDTSDYSCIVFGNDNNPAGLNDIDIRTIYEDSEGRIWIGTGNTGLSLMKYREDKPSDPEFINFMHDPENEKSISNGAVLSIMDDKNGNLWVGTENGGLNVVDLTRFNEDDCEFFHYRYNPADDESISNNSIHYIFKDKQGTVWIGTYGNGVSYFNKILYSFIHYYHIPNIKNSLNNNMVNAIFEEGDNLWIGTEGGLNILDTKTGNFQHFVYDHNNSKSIGSNAVWAIFKDSRSNIYIGTWGGGLNIFDYKTKTFTRHKFDANDNESIGSNNIFGIIEDKQGILWIACMNGGLNKYDYKTGKFKRYLPDENPHSISNPWVRTLMESSYNEIWVSTSISVDVFNKEKEEFIHFTHDANDPKKISYNGALVIVEDSKKNIWLGTEDGLNLFNRADSTFKYYLEEDGLPDNVIKGICEDDHGNLWLSTNKGLSKFINGINTPENPVFENFDESNGLQGNEFNRRAFCKGKDGKMYFGGINGFNVFHPDSIMTNPYIPKIVFTDFLVFNRAVEIGDEDSPLMKHINETKEIVLSHKQSVITIKYAALNFLNPIKNQYEYKLEGFDKEWNYIRSKREATFTNLDPKTYTFRVRASNNDGIWNKEGISLKITVLPPWWKTTIFKILAILFIVVSSISFYLIRVNRLKKQKIYLEKLVKKRTAEIEEKNKILIKQTNDLNETNILLEERQMQIEEQAEKLEVQKETLVERKASLEAANTQLKELNNTKDKFFSIIAHDLKNPFSTIIGFAELLKVKFEKLTEEKKYKYSEVIYDSSKNIYDLLENLLQWSRTQTNKIAFEPADFDLKQLIEQNVALIKENLSKKNITVEYETVGSQNLYADRNMINTVVRNLLTNAIKFTDNGGKITIDYVKKDGNVEIRIKDTGIGMSDEEIKQIFRVDANISKTGTNGETGTGLGLILCKEFINKNGGSIWVESKPGEGSKFLFTVPAQKQS